MTHTLRSTAFLGLFTLLLITSGCGSQEPSAKRNVALWNEFADQLAAIKSNGDLARALKGLEQLGVRMKENREAMKQLAQQMPPGQFDVTGENLVGEMSKATQRVKIEMSRLSQLLGEDVPAQIMKLMELNELGG